MTLKLFSLVLKNIECLDGFEAINGSSCKPCENGRYGRKCGYNCRCLNNQRLVIIIASWKQLTWSYMQRPKSGVW